MWRPATERRRFGPENPTIIACQWPRNQVLWVIERRKDDPLSVKHKSDQGFAACPHAPTWLLSAPATWTRGSNVEAFGVFPRSGSLTRRLASLPWLRAGPVCQLPRYFRGASSEDVPPPGDERAPLTFARYCSRRQSRSGSTSLTVSLPLRATCGRLSLASALRPAAPPLPRARLLAAPTASPSSALPLLPAGAAAPHRPPRSPWPATARCAGSGTAAAPACAPSPWSPRAPPDAPSGVAGTPPTASGCATTPAPPRARPAPPAPSPGASGSIPPARLSSSPSGTTPARRRSA